MSGTIDGGKAAAKTNKLRYGEDFYRQIGTIGGKKGTTGGFYADRELASRAGRKGGLVSRRTKTEVKNTNQGIIEKWRKIWTQ